MDKTLQDLAWLILPKEFREEVKKIYSHNPGAKPMPENTSRGKAILRDIFGHHNLTSDAEGEEMLYVSRKRVQEMFAEAQKAVPSCEYDRGFRGAELSILVDLFSSKCLPDESNMSEKLTSSEPKPAEPKKKFGMDARGWFRTGTAANGNPIKVRIPSGVTEPYTEQKEEIAKMKPIESKVSVYIATKKEDEEFRMLLHENGFKWKSGNSLISDSCWASYLEENKIHYVYPDKIVAYCGEKTSDTLTFTEFKKRYFKCNDHIVQDHEMVDNIIKDGFRNHNRLHIAAIIATGWIAHDGIMDPDILAADSLTIADALIAKAEKGGSK